MTLPGLPPPRHVVLPVPPSGAAAARRAGSRRRATAAGAVLGVLAIGVGVNGLTDRGKPNERVQIASAPPRPSDLGRPGRLSGRAIDETGRPLARVAVLRENLTAVLTRTAADGTWSVPCGSNLILAAYAPTTRGGAVRERSPGVGNHAWRRVAIDCGAFVRVVLPTGAVVLGRGTPGADVRLERARGRSTDVLPVGPVFVTRVRPDGTWRMEGLDTGRYRLSDGRVVDAREGRALPAPTPG
ncbi:MAG TPA: hypothetical protein VNA30_00530 [Mycobacteriales bacterium]|nr:hypothetical protein [Mycobacteriales bacterium]